MITLGYSEQREGDGWKLTQYGSPHTHELWLIDITPINDLIEHLLADECWCNPKIIYQEEIPVVTHVSKDLREKPEAPRIW